MRPRRQKSQTPVQVEINFDPDFEDLVEDKEMKDVRYVRVRVKRRKVVARPEVALLAAPASGDGPLVCPLKLRGEPVYKQEGPHGIVEFRAELDVEQIVANWQTVEQAAVKSLNKPLPFRFTVGIEKESDNDPELLERPGELRINLNRISWSWEALVREKGQASPDEGGGLDSPIEVTLDGTDSHGFRLTLELEERKPNGEYEKRDADFTHYLSPAVHEIDTTIIAPDPLPWALKDADDKSQIETTWWTQTLPAEHEIFTKLPIQTTIRVRAYPYKSIKQHVNGGAPVFDGDSTQYAMREIPLHLGAKKWEATVLEPSPADPPVMLEGDRPWEECVHAKIRLFAGNPNQAKSVEGTEVDWDFAESSKKVGTVSYEGQTGQTNGTWKVDGEGCVSFVFCPKRQNALFLDQKDDVQYYADFNVRLKDKKKTPEQSKIPSGQTPDDKTKPSFRLDWAPKVDLGIFKLPFFIKSDTPLDLEAEPDPEKAEAVPVTLAADQQTAYRMTFRQGGTIRLQPIVKWDTSGEGETTDIHLEYYRLTVGDEARKSKSDEPRKIHIADSKASGKWPETVIVKPPPDQKGASAGDLLIQPEIPLHPDILQRFKTINDKGKSLDSAVGSNPGMPEGANLGDWPDDRFHGEGVKFARRAVLYFCETESEKLCTNRKGIRAMLGAMAIYFDQADGAWKLLGDSVNLHRQIYKRYEESLVGAYFDLFGFETLKNAMKPVREMVEGTKYGKYLLNFFFPDRLIAAGFQACQTAVLKTRLAAWVGNTISDFTKKNSDALRQAEEALLQAEQRAGAASHEFDKALGECAEHARNLEGHVGDFLTTLEKYAKKLEELRAAGLSGDELRAALRPLRSEAEAAWEKVADSRGKWRTSLGTAVDNFKSGASAESQKATAKVRSGLHGHNRKFFDEVGGEYKGLLEGQEIDAEKMKEFMNKVGQGPGTEPPDVTRLRTAVNESVESNKDIVSDAVRDYDRIWRRLGEGTERVAGGRPFRIGVPVPNVGDEVGDLLQRRVNPTLEQAQAEINTATQNAAEFANRTQEINNRKVEKEIDAWHAFLKTFEEKVEDAQNEGDAPLQDRMDKFLSENEPTMPAESGLLSTMTGVITGALEKLKNLVVTVFSKLASVLKTVGWGLLWAIMLLVRGLFYFLSLLLQWIRGMLGKLMEWVAAVFEWIRDVGYGKFSALTNEAFNSGLSVSKEAGAGELFDFPYAKEVDLPRRLHSAAQEFSKEPEWVEKAKQSMEALFKSGYDDYYPRQFAETRNYFYNLCVKVLDRKNIEEPALESNDDVTQFGFVMLQAQGQLKRQIAGYARAVENAGKDKAGFGGSFWAEFEEVRGFNSVDLDIAISWIGWGSSWALRIVGCLVALAGLFTLLFGGAATVATVGGAAPVVGGVLGLEAVTVMGCFASAEFIDAVTALLRTGIAVTSYYPYASAYPRDATMMPAIYYGMTFKPSPAFAASNPNDVIAKSKVDFGY